MDYMSEYKRWLESDALSDDERAELRAVEGNNEEIESRFFAPLSFGTAGLRGVLGIGLNRMNRFTVGQAAQGLAKLIVSNGQAAMDRGVAIAYDSRHFRPSLPGSRPAFWRPTASKRCCLMNCARRPSCHLRSATMAASRASTSPRPTTPRSTTAIRSTGRTAHSCRPLKRT